MYEVIRQIMDDLGISNVESYSEEIKHVDIVILSDTSNNLKTVFENTILKFPSRDNVSITIIDDADDGLSFNNFNKLIEEQDFTVFDGSSVKINIHITKNISSDNRISIYNYDKFCEKMNSKTNIQIMNIFADILGNREYVSFEVLDKNIYFSTKTMEFIGSGIQSGAIEAYRQKKIVLIKDEANFRNMVQYSLLPEDFSFTHSNFNNLLENKFKKIESLLSTIYISNDAEIINQQDIRLRISGHRNVEVQYVIEDTQFNKEIVKIYKWIYNGGNTTDKAIIARNILSLHCGYTDLMNLDEKTFASIQSNFKLYQKEHVDKYLELKNNIAGNIIEIIEKASDLALSIPEGIKVNMLAVFSFFFTAVLANIVSDAPLQNIFTRDITVIIEIVLVASFMFLIFTVLETNYKIKQIEKGYAYLKSNYQDVFDEAELTSIFNQDDFEKATIREVRKKRNIFVVVWIVLLVMGIVVIEIVSSEPTLPIIIDRLNGLKRQVNDSVKNMMIILPYIKNKLGE